MVRRIGFADILARRADDDAELDLIVEPLGHPRLDGIVGAADAGRLLIKPDLVRRTRDPQPIGFLRMLAVIHANRQIFARPFDRSEKAHAVEGKPLCRLRGGLARSGKRVIAAVDDRQHGRIGIRQRVERGDAVIQQNAKSCLSGSLKSQQLHRLFHCSVRLTPAAAK